MNINVLSLGAGVQSSTVFLLSCKGLLPKLDYAVLADTQWEPQMVYGHPWWLVEEGIKANIPVLIGTQGNIREDLLNSSSILTQRQEEEKRWISVPLYVKNVKTGERGIIKRQCTKEYKLLVVERVIRKEILGLRRGARIPADVHVNQWIGISVDERQRMRLSGKQWITNEYPLIGFPTQYMPTPWTRTQCSLWFAKNYPGRTLPKSACVGCPYRKNDQWQDLKNTSPEEFAEACFVDEEMRKRGGDGREFFLHSSCVPLKDVDFSKPTEEGLFDRERLGMCGT